MRFIISHAQLLISIGFGFAAYSLISLGMPNEHYKMAVGWDAGILFYIGNTIRTMRCATTKQLDKNAIKADVSGAIMFIVMIVSSFLSLYLALAILNDVKEVHTNEHELAIGLALYTIISSWALVQVMFAVHYTHHYYSHNKNDNGGLEFPSAKKDEEPDFWDFLYFSLVLGMTFQVSDVQINRKHMRHLALWHGVVAFFFNTFILASMVNMAASLFS